MKCWESKNVTIGNKGFTLAEILVVIAILSILLSLAIPVYGKFADNAKECSYHNNILEEDEEVPFL